MSNAVSNAVDSTSPVKRSASRARASGSRLPNTRDVLEEHVRAIGVMLRIAMLITVAIAVVAVILFAIQIADGDMNRSLVTQPSSLPGIVGALLPIALWAREDRFGPGFLWTLPVDRSRHALLKVLAGWLWLMGGVVLFSVALLVIALVGGSGVLPVETLQVLTDSATPGAPIDPSTLRVVQWSPGPLIWLIPFASASAAYLLASAFIVGIRHPLRWIAGGVALFALSTLASHMIGRLIGREGLGDAPGRMVAQLIQGRFGLEALLTLRTWSLDYRATLTTGERIHAWFSVPNLGDWGIAALLWTAAGALAVWLAASRHREGRRA